VRVRVRVRVEKVLRANHRNADEDRRGSAERGTIMTIKTSRSSSISFVDLVRKNIMVTFIIFIRKLYQVIG
jgi:hypothetical protein